MLVSSSPATTITNYIWSSLPFADSRLRLIDGGTTNLLFDSHTSETQRHRTARPYYY